MAIVRAGAKNGTGSAGITASGTGGVIPIAASIGTIGVIGGTGANG